jgi:uncharacterized protein (DUF305 family)
VRARAFHLPEIEALCVEIVRAQKEEIAQMREILARY